MTNVIKMNFLNLGKIHRLPNADLMLTAFPRKTYVKPDGVMKLELLSQWHDRIAKTVSRTANPISSKIIQNMYYDPYSNTGVRIQILDLALAKINSQTDPRQLSLLEERG